MGYVQRIAIATVFICFGGVAAKASDVVLTVTGSLPGSEANGAVQYSVDDLRALGEVSFSTSTPWTAGPQTFEGVPLSRLVEDLKIEDGALEAIAVNDYAVSIPVEEAKQDGPIIAYLRNGKPMSLRDKGPLWIVYPYDSDAAFQTEIVYSRSIWQLDQIVVKE